MFCPEPAIPDLLRGGISFSSLIPLRSIPAKLIAVLGLDAESFPRRDYEIAFDIMKAFPLRGDRSRRETDKYLFLETLMSAEKYLFLSFIAWDDSDNSEKNPSFTIIELLEYIFF